MYLHTYYCFVYSLYYLATASPKVRNKLCELRAFLLIQSHMLQHRIKTKITIATMHGIISYVLFLLKLINC